MSRQTDPDFPIYKVRHKTPCKECPFRRAAPAGWLGPDPLDHYVTSITFDLPISCHLTREKDKAPAACAGSLIHIANQCKSPREADFAHEAAKVAVDTKIVFQWPHEFEAHHSDGLLAAVAKMRGSK